MSPLLKKWLQSEKVIKILTWFGSAYMRFVYRTTRWTFHGFDIPQTYLDKGKGFVTCFWHNKLFMGVFGWRFPQRFSMVISSHKDGRLIAETVKWFGIQWIVGSSSKGGSQVIRTAVRCLKRGEVVGITPDGPRGPRHKVQPGVISIAQLAQVDILPFSFDLTHKIILNTWDKFVVPLPFGRGILAWGAPVILDRMENQVLQNLLEERMDSHENFCVQVLKREKSCC